MHLLRTFVASGLTICAASAATLIAVGMMARHLRVAEVLAWPLWLVTAALVVAAFVHGFRPWHRATRPT